jgi:hypothetical protein
MRHAQDTVIDETVSRCRSTVESCTGASSTVATSYQVMLCLDTHLDRRAPRHDFLSLQFFSPFLLDLEDGDRVGGSNNLLLFEAW